MLFNISVAVHNSRMIFHGSCRRCRDSFTTAGVLGRCPWRLRGRGTARRWATLPTVWLVILRRGGLWNTARLITPRWWIRRRWIRTQGTRSDAVGFSLGLLTPLGRILPRRSASKAKPSEGIVQVPGQLTSAMTRSGDRWLRAGGGRRLGRETWSKALTCSGSCPTCGINLHRTGFAQRRSQRTALKHFVKTFDSREPGRLVRRAVGAKRGPESVGRFVVDQTTCCRSGVVSRRMPGPSP